MAWLLCLVHTSDGAWRDGGQGAASSYSQYGAGVSSVAGTVLTYFCSLSTEQFCSIVQNILFAKCTHDMVFCTFLALLCGVKYSVVDSN